MQGKISYNNDKPRKLNDMGSEVPRSLGRRPPSPYPRSQLTRHSRRAKFGNFLRKLLRRRKATAVKPFVMPPEYNARPSPFLIVRSPARLGRHLSIRSIRRRSYPSVRTKVIPGIQITAPSKKRYTVHEMPPASLVRDGIPSPLKIRFSHPAITLMAPPPQASSASSSFSAATVLTVTGDASARIVEVDSYSPLPYELTHAPEAGRPESTYKPFRPTSQPWDSTEVLQYFQDAIARGDDLDRLPSQHINIFPGLFEAYGDEPRVVAGAPARDRRGSRDTIFSIGQATVASSSTAAIIDVNKALPRIPRKPSPSLKPLPRPAIMTPLRDSRAYISLNASGDLAPLGESTSDLEMTDMGKGKAPAGGKIGHNFDELKAPEQLEQLFRRTGSGRFEAVLLAPVGQIIPLCPQAATGAEKPASPSTSERSFTPGDDNAAVGVTSIVRPVVRRKPIPSRAQAPQVDPKVKAATRNAVRDFDLHAPAATGSALPEPKRPNVYDHRRSAQTFDEILRPISQVLMNHGPPATTVDTRLGVAMKAAVGTAAPHIQMLDNGYPKFAKSTSSVHLFAAAQQEHAQAQPQPQPQPQSQPQLARTDLMRGTAHNFSRKLKETKKPDLTERQRFELNVRMNDNLTRMGLI